jgi:NitT/TauT family transport system substrate-binding protein
MSSPTAIPRRRFLTRTAALGAASLLGNNRLALAEPPPEVPRVRIVQTPALCFAPQFLAEDLLRLEGFAEVEYVKTEGSIPETLVNSADLAIFGGPSLLPPIDAGLPIVTLSGIHVGCWELFANDRIHAIRDLKAKTIAIVQHGGVDHIWLSSILAYVGMDPRTDVRWLPAGRMSESQRLFVEGQADAFLAFPPQPQELRSRKAGKVIVNTTFDRPWSQYFCCMLAGRRDFVRKHPVATKRALRAMLKATDICAEDPERAARYLVAKGYHSRYEIALEIVKNLPYDRWRTSNPADTLRFHALRLYDVGMIKTNPNGLIAQGSDWRFLNELKRELKA